MSELSKIEVIKLQARKTRGEYVQYVLTLPRGFIEELGWQKGDTLIVRIMELKIDGVERKVVVYYKP
ncbi:MAG: hypothetical protein QXL22_06370 [Candidatus Nezhaarchaeales archaeon]